MIKNFKKNQVIIFVIALMLVTAGYLNFTTNQQQQNLVPTSTLAESEEMASIGDATLVSANETKIEPETEIEPETQNTNQNESISENNYFAQSRLDRDNMYSQMLANYQTILESENIAADEKKIAQEEIKRMNNEKN